MDACEGFKAAAPRVRRRFSRNNDQRMRGESYPADSYDEMVGEALKKVASSTLLLTETMPIALASDGAGVDPFTTARIERDREAATARYLRDRDVTGLQRAMERLDRDEQDAQARPRDVVTAALARHHLSNLAELWRDTQPEGRRAIAEAAFDRIDVLGLDLVVHPSAEAERYGWSEAFGSEPLVCSISRSGRGERI
jgi:hypothetical protein